MSDVGLHFDGLVALLAVLAMDGILLFGLAVSGSLGWIRYRRTQVVIRSQTIHRHLVGASVCLVVYSCIGLTIFLHGLKPSPSPLEAWLDRWLCLWMPAILLLWPVSAAMVRKRRISPHQGKVGGAV